MWWSRKVWSNLKTLRRGFFTNLTECYYIAPIHPFPAAYQGPAKWQQAKQRNPDVVLPHLQAIWDIKDLRYVLGWPSGLNSWMCPEHHQVEAATEHPHQMPKLPQLDPLNLKEQRSYSDLFMAVQLVLSASPWASGSVWGKFACHVQQDLHEPSIRSNKTAPVLCF